jgi:hypothetical protein
MPKFLKSYGENIETGSFPPLQVIEIREMDGVNSFYTILKNVGGTEATWKIRI